MDLSSVLKSPLFVFTGVRQDVWFWDLVESQARVAFIKYSKLKQNFLSGYFTSIWMHVLSSWIWLLNFEGITFGPEELLLFQQVCNYCAAKLFLEKNVYFNCPWNCWKVLKLLICDFSLLFWHRKWGEKSPTGLSISLLVVHCNRKKSLRT